MPAILVLEKSRQEDRGESKDKAGVGDPSFWASLSYRKITSEGKKEGREAGKEREKDGHTQICKALQVFNHRFFFNRSNAWKQRQPRMTDSPVGLKIQKAIRLPSETNYQILRRKLSHVLSSFKKQRSNLDKGKRF